MPVPITNSCIEFFSLIKLILLFLTTIAKFDFNKFKSGRFRVNRKNKL